MHWKNGHFIGPLVVDQDIYITEYKHYAVRGEDSLTIFGDASVGTKALGKNIYVISNGYYNLDADNNININTKGSIEIKSTWISKINAGSDFEVNALNGTGKVSSTGQLDIISSNNKVKINGNTAVEITTTGTASITSNGNCSVVSNNGELALTSKGKANLASSDGDVDINSVNALLNLKAKSGITVSTSVYGTSLPTTGGTEGRVYFKLIS